MKTRAFQNLILIRSKGRGIWYLEEYGRNTGIDLSMRIIRSEDVSQGSNSRLGAEEFRKSFTLCCATTRRIGHVACLETPDKLLQADLTSKSR
jgi:hypothetical protein